MQHLIFKKDVGRNNKEINETENISARQVFGAFKKSNEGYLILNKLIRKQLYICPICKSSLTNKKFEIDHIIPIVLIPSWKSHLVTCEDNLMVLCSHCNKSKSSKYEGYYKLYFHRENYYENNKIYSKDIYKDYNKLIKTLIKNMCDDKDLQQRWNRDLIILNQPLNFIIEKRLILEVDIVIDE